MTGGGGGALDAGPDPFCSIACSEPYVCQPTRMGGTCVPGYVLNFTQPTPGQSFNGPGATTAGFVLTARRTDGGVPSLSSIPFSIPGLTSPPPPSALQLTATPGEYRAAAGLPLDTRTFQAVAGWDGGPMATVDFNVDRLPPVVTLELPPIPGTEFPRDAVIPVAIRSTKQLSLSVTLTLTGTDGGVTAQLAPVANSFCAALNLGVRDRCGQLDLSTPPMGGGLTADFTAAVTATDFAGNVGTATATVPVTRIRWRLISAFSGGVVRAAPALDRQGNLFIGTQDTATTGRVLSYSPAGALRFAVPVGAVQSISIAESDVSGSLQELAYVATNTGPSSAAMRVMMSDGGTLATGSFTSCADGQRSTYSAIGLYDAGLNMNGGLAEVAAVMVFNPQLATDNSVLCSYGPRSGTSAAIGPPGLSQPNPDGTTLLSPANIVFAGNKGWVQRNDLNNQLNYINVNPLSSGGSSAGYAGIGAVPTGLALGNGAIVATWANAGVNNPIATYLMANPVAPITTAGGAWSTARPVAIMSSAVITPTDRLGVNWLYSLTQSGTSLGTPTAVGDPVSGANAGGTTPVVGTGQRVYVVRRDGHLFAFDGASSSGVAGRNPVWSGVVFASNPVDVVAHPTLDCSRNGAGRPGTLYVVSLNGQTTAVIVDSTKLEPNAPWPKWQRTAGNAGNPDFPLNPGCP